MRPWGGMSTMAAVMTTSAGHRVTQIQEAQHAGDVSSSEVRLDEDLLCRESEQSTETGAIVGQQSALPNFVPSAEARKRKRGKAGPDARVAPSEETAITRAMKTWEQRRPAPILFPYEGTDFNSFEEAKEFYNLYSWEVGFGIRINRGRTNDNTYITKKDLCCSSEGRSKNPRSATCRTGCKAMIRLLRTEDHGWYISRSITVHNHPLSESCGEKKQWNSHSEINPITKDFIRRLRENNVSTGRVCSILGTGGVSGGLPIRREVIRSVCAKIAQENIADDLTKTMRLLETMRETDKEMEIRFQLDGEGRMQHMLWCTGRNKFNYKHFGDALTFDTTYRTNLYNMPFGLFVGVNNHFQSCIFGGVLLTTEKTEDFEWAFSTFIEIMGGKEPCTILTDQCQAMAAAIRTTMKKARHRWCKWHVLRKAKQWVGTPYSSKNSSFKNEFHKLVTEEVCPQKFERRWRQLIRTHELEKNKFLKRIYLRRGMWARPYFMSVFCAGMTSTQRSESANHMLKQFIRRSAPMHLFVSKFNEFQCDRQEQEDKETHVTKQVRRQTRIGVPIERHAEEIYTRAMYERFSNELYHSGSYSIKGRDSSQGYVLAHYKEPDSAQQRSFVVREGEQGEMICSCGLYEHEGMLCRHALKVLVHLERSVIPSANIKIRWTKEAAQISTGGQSSTRDAAYKPTCSYIRNQLLLKQVYGLAGVHASVPESSLAEAMAALDKILALGNAQLNVEETSGAQHNTLEGNVPRDCPPRPTKRGRRSNTSLKSYENERHRQSKKGKHVIDSIGPSSTDEENRPSGKMKAINDLLLDE